MEKSRYLILHHSIQEEVSVFIILYDMSFFMHINIIKSDTFRANYNSTSFQKLWMHQVTVERNMTYVYITKLCNL